MPRDTSGTYNLPPSNPVAGNTPIRESWREQTLTDISNALTASPAGPLSVTPQHFNNDQVGFQNKIGVYALVAALEPRLLALESANNAKIGRIRAFAFGTTPAHYLPCNGAAVSRTTYAKLFAKIGTTFGAGDGSTTFNVPELRGESIRGLDNGRGVDVGRALGSFQDGQVPVHTHTASSASTGDHSHSGSTSSDNNHQHTASTGVAGAHQHTYSFNTGLENQDHTHTFSASTSASGDHIHYVVPQVTNKPEDGGSARVYTIGSGPNVSYSTEAGAHAHSFSGTTAGVGANHTHVFNVDSSYAGNHNHAITGAEGGAHSHSLSTDGGQGSHTHAVTINATGSAEARVDNVALNLCIRFE